MSGARRFFAENITIGAETELVGEEFEHAKNVLRIGMGDEVILLGQDGLEYSAVCCDVQKKSLKFHVLSAQEGGREATSEITLIFGYLKNADKNEFIVQKAVELGVKKIVAFSSAYSSAYMNENKLERLNKVSREAAKQCLRSVAPKVVYCPDFLSALKEGADAENKLFACEFASKSEKNIASLCGSTAIVVGSEGGFSEAEASQASEQGYAKITLGKRILRAETAAVALTAVVAFALGELGEVAP